MGLLDRVSTLVRANLNDLVDRAEDPSKMIKQVILDMENQLLQVKTQVAISIADQHMLEKKEQESREKIADWMRKAEIAVDKEQDDLARAALERHKSAERTDQREEGHAARSRSRLSISPASRRAATGRSCSRRALTCAATAIAALASGSRISGRRSRRSSRPSRSSNRSSRKRSRRATC